VLFLNCTVPQSMRATQSALRPHGGCSSLSGFFLQTAFPDFQVLGEGTSQDGSRWLHIGTPETYIALSPTRAEPEKRWMTYLGMPGVNHLAYEVDDVEALCQRMKSAGFRESTPPNAHPHRKRRYFYDSQGNDWEFIQYLSKDPAERNDYRSPDR
jgi:catechol 2,3-dioxygenase-like lactoylglutathione lyase family enzyme